MPSSKPSDCPKCGCARRHASYCVQCGHGGTSAQRDENRFGDEDRANMRATAAQLGDSDALAALRIGDEPTTRKASQVIEKALWACGGLIVDDLRESEYTWVYRNVYDAYLEAFQDAAEPYDYDASGAA